MSAELDKLAKYFRDKGYTTVAPIVEAAATHARDVGAPETYIETLQAEINIVQSKDLNKEELGLGEGLHERPLFQEDDDMPIEYLTRLQQGDPELKARERKARENFETPLSELLEDRITDCALRSRWAQPVYTLGRKLGPGFMRTHIEEKGSMGTTTPRQPFRVGKKQ